MFYLKSKTEKSGLDKAIDEIFSEMQGFTADAEEYSKMTLQLERLYALKQIDCPNRVSPDTLTIVIGNIVGIVLIIGYERSNILTSKALNLLFKLR
jgi:hypothetical protein